MKTRQALIDLNLANLTSLWQAAGAPFDANHSGNGYQYTQVADSDWPNRFWLQPGVDDASQIGHAIAAFQALPGMLTFPYWDLHGSGHDVLFEGAGLVKRFEQAGMSLPLTDHFPAPQRLTFEQVKDATAAKAWAALYPLGFGYVIGEQIPAATYDTLQFFQASYEGVPAGTAILFRTGDIAGIHGVGVAPEMRRKGFAEEIMQFVLNKAIDAGASYATLQASQMGKGLYLKMGFDDLFVIRNYVQSI